MSHHYHELTNEKNVTNHNAQSSHVLTCVDYFLLYPPLYACRQWSIMVYICTSLHFYIPVLVRSMSCYMDLCIGRPVLGGPTWHALDSRPPVDGSYHPLVSQSPGVTLHNPPLIPVWWTGWCECSWSQLFDAYLSAYLYDHQMENHNSHLIADTRLAHCHVSFLVAFDQGTTDDGH